MGRIIPDRQGELRPNAFFAFGVPFDDDKENDSPVLSAARSPTDAALRDRGEVPYRWITPYSTDDDVEKLRECPSDPEHVTYSLDRKMSGEACGGNRLASFVPMNVLCPFAVSDEFRRRIERLKLTGAHFHSMKLRDTTTGNEVLGVSSFQFAGRARIRLPTFVDAVNACPFCSKGKIVCEGCLQWNPYCLHCKREMTVPAARHGGNDDKRVPFEPGLWSILDGKHWDGSDLVQTSGGNRMFASKRFIDWLLRVHAAPFCAEPVDLYIDGMSEEQHRWLKDLEEPLES
jgi:hypothetical protein